MEIVKKVLTDACVIKLNHFSDPRGTFNIMYNIQDFKNKVDSKVNFTQDNLSISKKNVFRGFHFQKHQFSQSKLVSVIKGSVIDIIVDLRPESKTFMEWFSIELNVSNSLQLFIPKGFAHGFISLENDTMFQYKVDNIYNSNFDSGINPKDPFFNKISLNLNDCLISNKDANLPYIDQIDFESLWKFKK
tara:strand:+ start:547 stop:1113 length:567 start_codon:yes stop_codon:yes gene_type:complete